MTHSKHPRSERTSRRSVLTGAAGAAAGLAAGAAVFRGASPALAGTSSVTLLTPTGDTTGAGDLDAIMAAFGSSPVVGLSAGTFYINAPIVMPGGGVLEGSGTPPPLPSSVPVTAGTVLQLTSGFSGSAAINLSGLAQVTVSDLTIDASQFTGSCDGILTSGTTDDIRLSNLLIQSVPGIGVASSATGGNTMYASNVTVHQASGSGFNCQMTDSTWRDCLAEGCGRQGFYISEGSENSKWTGCRAEWSGDNGFYITGSWNTGDGSGGIQLDACSTDRNGQDGLQIAPTGGNAPVLVSGFSARRDGSSSTSASYAGVHVNASAMPVILDGAQVYPGVNDNGSGNDSPEYGLNVTATSVYVGISNAFLHAVSAGTNNMTTGNNCNWRAVATRTGSTGSPGSVTLVADSA
jgi:hypothetical protein